MNNKSNNKPRLQFTELTPDDILINKSLYTRLLKHDKAYEENCKELDKAKKLFYNTFK